MKLSKRELNQLKNESNIEIGTRVIADLGLGDLVEGNVVAIKTDDSRRIILDCVDDNSEEFWCFLADVQN
jgi:hypothetical protein